MLTRVRFAMLLVFLLALVVMFVVQPEFWPRNWLWGWSEPLLDSEGEAIGEVFVEQVGGHKGELLPLPPGDTGTIFKHPLIAKFYPANFQPIGHTSKWQRYGAVLFRGGNQGTEPCIVIAVKVTVNPEYKFINEFRPVIGVETPSANRFFAGEAEAVLAVTELDPSGNGNGSLAFVVSGASDRQLLPGEDEEHLPGVGKIVIVRNAWGNPSLFDDPDPDDPDGFLYIDEVPGLTGPIGVAIDEETQEVVVVEKPEDGEGDVECAVGKSPLRFFRLADGTEARRLCIDGVGDSADIEVDRAPDRIPRGFIARNFSQGGVAVIRLDNYTEDTTLNLYPAGADNPAPGLELDLDAGLGYLAAPHLPTAGVREFNLATLAFQRDYPADVYYHTRDSDTKTGLQEVSVANFPNGQNDIRRGIVISRSDLDNYPNRADQVTRINLVTGNTNRLNTDKQTTAIAFVPQRSTDQSNQQFFLRIRVLSTEGVRFDLKKYDHGTVP